MSLAAEPAPGERQLFPAKAILALVLVGIAAFAAFTVLATYAPDIRARNNGQAHALSGSAVGYRGATVMLQALGAPVRISRTRPSPRELAGVCLVLTPGPFTRAEEVRKLPPALRTLIVLPKWMTAPDPLRPGFVRKAGFLPAALSAADALSVYEPGSQVGVQAGFQRPVLRTLAGGPWEPGGELPLGRLDGLQTIGGPGWAPVLVDRQGHAVLVRSKSHPAVYVLADPDLLNNQGLADFTTAQSGMALLQAMAGADGLVFDVTLNGLGGGRSLSKLMLQPPWLAATLCVLAAAVLMGWQALARFGAPALQGRAIALGAAALVDNSAGLIRMARKEPALGGAYAEATLAQVAQAGGAAPATSAGEGADEWLARVAERRGLDDPRALTAEAGRARTREELTAAARKLYRWRLEMTRERE